MPKVKSENTVAELRRENLRRLIAVRGGANALAKELGYSNASFLSQMCGAKAIRDVTEKTARSFERKLGLPEGHLDRENGAAAPLPYEQGPLSQEVLLLVGKALEDEGVSLPPMKLMDLIAVALSAPDPELVRRIVRLLK